MPVLELPANPQPHDGELVVEPWSKEGSMCDERERRWDSEPAIFPSLLFTEDEARSVNWDAVFVQ
jgi:hypothetical protein